MGTLESRFSERVADFRRRSQDLRRNGPADPAAERRLRDEETEYLLDSVPFIREYASEAKASPASAVGQMANFVEVTHTSNRNNVLKRYLMQVEKQVDATTMAAAVAHDDAGSKLNPREAEFICPECNAGMTYHARESMLVCRSCGLCRPFSEMNANNLTYEQEIHQDVVTYYSYKRLNHFCEWLNSLQAKVRGFFCVADSTRSTRVTWCPAASLLAALPPWQSWPSWCGCLGMRASMAPTSARLAFARTGVAPARRGPRTATCPTRRGPRTAT